MALATYLLLYPASEQYDLLASIVGGFLLVTLAVLGILFVLAMRVVPEEADVRLDSDRGLPEFPISSQISIPATSLPPFIRLEILRKFDCGGLQSSTIKVIGGRVEHLEQKFVAEHRGIWRSNGLVVTIGDSLGFFSLKRFINCPLEVLCYPKQEGIPHIAITPSAFQSGDLSHPNAPRSGDPLDMKAYDKGDGISRIMWKIFARTGELYVRIPEQAVYPESEVFVYLVADKNDDKVSAKTWEFIKQLVAQNIRVKFGTDLVPGMYSGCNLGVHETELSKMELMIACSGTSSLAGTGERFASFRDSFSGEVKVVVICSALSSTARDKLGFEAIQIVELNEI